MSTTRHLLYASDVLPALGHGGRVIADRHLRRMAAAGWTVTVVSPFGQTAGPGPWREVQLPARQWWTPPFRPAQPLLAGLRSAAWRRALVAAGVPRADAVATICWGPASWLAASLAADSRCPLVVLVHDWWKETGTPADALIGRHVCAAAHTVFAVSTEMQAALSAECGRAIEVLYPVPAGRTQPFAEWRETHRSPSVAHVGTLQPYHEDFLRTLAASLATRHGRLLLLCPRDNPTAAALARDCRNLVQHDFFSDNADALRWIAENASALAVMYPFGQDKSGAVPTGFPSRFVEFSQLGLPVLLAAPVGNPIQTWAEARAWTGRCDPRHVAALDRWSREIGDSAMWRTLAGETRRAATDDFDADRIHARFAAALTS